MYYSKNIWKSQISILQVQFWEIENHKNINVSCCPSDLFFFYSYILKPALKFVLIV